MRGVAKVGGSIIADKVSFSVVASEDYLHGHYTNQITGKKQDGFDNQSLTGRIFITPNSDLTIDLKAGYVRMKGAGLAYLAQFPGNLFYSGTVIDVNNATAPFVSDLPAVSRTRKYNGSARVDYQLGFDKISAVSSYSANRDVNYRAAFPYLPAPDGTPQGTQNNHYGTKAFFEELKFISEKHSGFRSSSRPSGTDLVANGPVEGKGSAAGTT
ncbi:MAG: hypothetical protein JWO15_958 [Sphingomonadales bacterium]|nr:hypothetical protein [Sphingomonadales bacterium]